MMTPISHRTGLRSILGTIAIGALGVACASAETVVVSTRGDNAIVYLSGATGQEIGKFDGGLGAHEIAVSPDGMLAIGSAYGSGEHHKTPDQRLFLIDIAARKVVRVIDLGDEHKRPNDLVFMPDNRHVLVTSEGSRSVVKVDTATGTIAQVYAHGEAGGHMMAVAPDFGRAYVSCVPGGMVAVIDLKSGEIVNKVKTAPGAEGIAVSPDGKRVWCANNRSQSVSVIDTGTMEVVETIKSEGFPFRVRFTPDGSRVVITHPMADKVRVFDAATFALVADIPCGDQGRERAPTSVAVSQDGARAFVVCAASDEVAVIDLKGLKVESVTAAGPDADGLAVTPLDVAAG